MNQATIPEVAAALRAAHSVLVVCHVRPDGDALGSLLALGLGLERLGKRVTMVSPDGVPALYRFLPQWERIRCEAPPDPVDVAVGVDADGAARLGSAMAAVLHAPVVIDLDHHRGPEPFGHLPHVDPDAAATGEIVYSLLCELGVTLDREIACCLMTALLTDTGSFRYPSVTAWTLAIAAELVAAGASPARVFEAVYEQQSPGAARLLGLALAKLELAADGAIVWSALSRADFAQAGAADDETEGILNALRAIQGVRVALLLREEADGSVRVSLRARDTTDVGAVARSFGGGGHRAAAGCTLPGPLAEAARRVLAAVTAELTRS